MIAPMSIGFTAAFVITLGVSLEAAAQVAPPEAWKLVPALPTTCYRDDAFNDRLRAAGVAITNEVERQGKINAAARERFDNMDISEKAQRMQAFMMKNPQAAMKMMQGEQAAGASAQTAIAEAGEAGKRLETELQQLQASFRTAAEQSVKPIKAQQKQLIDTKTTAVGEASIPMFTNAADHAQYVRLVAQENAAYESACAPYFGASGSFHKWVSGYRTEVIDKLMSTTDAGEGAMIMQMQAMDLPGGGYRSTVPLQQVNTFLNRLQTIWGIRENQATAVVELRK
jgi:hypothetical protein